ncbi:MAG: hypothetical protein FWF95_07005 [Syntrophorhabdaceae bacterium]|nr:hypothetical protein [Syntrophorhabdaceae bacterium]
MKKKSLAAVSVPFRVTAPNRIDLAGGTLDIYPLYLLLDGAMTVNAAISIRSVVEVRPFERGGVRLRSENFNVSVVVADTHKILSGGKLGLIARALRHFPAVSGLDIVVRNEAPVGSGIGASSALLVALMAAMGRVTGARNSWKETALAAMEIEASHLKGLAGRQDHVAALRGGVQGIGFLPGRLDIRRFSPGGGHGRMLQAYGILANSEISHRSSDVNWRMIRGAIDGDAAVLRKFRGIAAAARDAWEAVSASDPDALAKAVSAEWNIRRTLAKEVSPGKIEALLGDRRFRRLVSGAKLCGAGNGGMLFGILRDPTGRAEAESIIRAFGMSVMPFRLSGGLRFENIRI